eukprot:TRINITY_DN13411_c0_g1_i1.p1 TRINITY_DN13411_c0_g1~~TRINITY_DN13411_c0_g1_i1.p1  ORF type:complete len:202 (-),score=37.74 TRINITY_DN13411_c0_g1_i1:115-720(-)
MNFVRKTIIRSFSASVKLLMPVPKHIKTHSAFQEELSGNANKLVVVDYYADWCGPCKAIAPLYQQLADQYPHAVFLKVNVDENRETSSANGISAMPTFQFYKNGTKLTEFRGADQAQLRDLVAKHAIPPVERAVLAHSIRDMKAALTKKGISFADCPEKPDLVERYLTSLNYSEIEQIAEDHKMDKGVGKEALLKQIQSAM